MSWADDMDRAMEQHPEQFGMVIDSMGNPVDTPRPPEPLRRWAQLAVDTTPGTLAHERALDALRAALASSHAPAGALRDVEQAVADKRIPVNYHSGTAYVRLADVYAALAATRPADKG